MEKHSSKNKKVGLENYSVLKNCILQKKLCCKRQRKAVETLQIKQDGRDMTEKCNTCSQGGTWLEEKMLRGHYWLNRHGRVVDLKVLHLW